MNRGLTRGLASLVVSLWPGLVGAHTAVVEDDAEIDLRHPRRANGSGKAIHVGRFSPHHEGDDAGEHSGPGGERQGLIRFDLGGLPSGPRVAQATVRLWLGEVRRAGTLELRPVFGPWEEGTVSADSAPPFGDVLAVWRLRGRTRGIS